jgi:bifunctional DNA-binding transcriptional regulator/antitoxin component of YhaV-PrlF toxin-antitoxin module
MSTRKIGTTGANASYFLTIPKDVIKKLKWRKGQRVVVERKGETIVIKDFKDD